MYEVESQRIEVGSALQAADLNTQSITTERFRFASAIAVDCSCALETQDSRETERTRRYFNKAVFQAPTSVTFFNGTRSTLEAQNPLTSIPSS